MKKVRHKLAVCWNTAKITILCTCCPRAHAKWSWGWITEMQQSMPLCIWFRGFSVFQRKLFFPMLPAQGASWSHSPISSLAICMPCREACPDSTPHLPFGSPTAPNKVFFGVLELFCRKFFCNRTRIERPSGWWDRSCSHFTAFAS